MLAAQNSDELIYIWSLYTRKMHHFQGYFFRTFQDLKLKFPGLSRTNVFLQDFPGPGIFKKKNPGLSRRRGNPEKQAVETNITNS